MWVVEEYRGYFGTRAEQLYMAAVSKIKKTSEDDDRERLKLENNITKRKKELAISVFCSLYQLPFTKNKILNDITH